MYESSFVRNIVFSRVLVVVSSSVFLVPSRMTLWRCPPHRWTSFAELHLHTGSALFR
jgi:hypothetical protein